MNKADEYRECAAECLRLAMRAKAHERRLILLEMSDRWLALSKLAERFETHLEQDTSNHRHHLRVVRALRP